MRREWLRAAALWVVLTVIVEFVAVKYSILPAGYSREAGVVDDAYNLLLVLGVPVFTFVVTVIILGLTHFRSDGRPTDDAPRHDDSRRVVAIWLIVTTALALVILVNPGFIGLAEIRGESSADVVVSMEARRFRWDVDYENGRTSNEELVLPVGERVRFDITSIDVIHSFWIPGFRVKIDAVPGHTTQVYVTPEQTGSYDDDINFRVQCAELCGPSHGDMWIPLKVVDRVEYEAYIASLPEEGA